MSETTTSQFVNMKETITLLREQKKLFVESEESFLGNSLGFAFCIHVHDENNNKYSLLINHNNNQIEVHGAKIKSKYLKSFNHPNIIQYIDDFTLDNYYFIQTERIQPCLLSWFNDTMLKNSMTEHDYVEIALQMLEVTQYINKHKCSIYLQSTLTTFTIDQERKIKLIHFTTPQLLNIAKVKQVFNECKEQNSLFYYFKEILKMDNQCLMWQNYDIDLWAIGICLYYLSGASISHILNYILDEDSLHVSEYLGFQNNIKLYSLICDQVYLEILPSFLHSTIEEQKKQKGDDHSTSNEEEKDYKSKYDEIKEDFLIFQELHQQLSDNQSEINQFNNIKLLIEKYGQSDSLLYLQTRVFTLHRKFEDAFRLAEDFINKNPSSYFSYHCLGVIYEEQEQFEKAIEYYKKSIKINHFGDVDCYNIGSIYQDQKSDKAIKYYKKATEINSNLEDAYFNLATVYESKLSHQNAIYSYKKALETNNKDVDTLNNLAYNCYQQCHFSKSLYFQKQVVELEDDPESIIWLNHIKRSI